MKIQIARWHGDSWQELSGPNTVYDVREAAERAVELYIHEATAYDLIGHETITVLVDDGKEISTWDVETEATFRCYATRRVQDGAQS